MSRGLPRRRVLALMGAALVERACIAQGSDDALTPERFGAKGDGVANDTAAFAALAAEVQRRGGGEVVLRRTTYLVGRQRATRGAAHFYQVPDPIFSVADLTRPLRIVGNGATLRCAAGLLFGSFDPATGRALPSQGPNLDGRTIATPYGFMIQVERSAASVEITDLELDGNAGALRVGGAYGDVGIQIAAGGILLRDNRGDEVLRNVHAHDHGQDGLMIDGLDRPAPGTRRIAEAVRCERNGRQGCSIIGGRGWEFRGCTFARSGRGRVASPPNAGVDVEAEGRKINRGHRFTDCSFIDNAGAGFVADTGDSADIRFTRCRFVGTTAPSIWPNKPGVRFDDCRIVGTAVGFYGNADPALATQFADCLFTDDPALSPTRRVYRQGRTDGSLADLATRQNILFARCRFLAVGGATLPWSIAAIYRDCIMRQAGRGIGYPRGRYEGRNDLRGQIDLTGSRIVGQVLLNGVARPRG